MRNIYHYGVTVITNCSRRAQDWAPLREDELQPQWWMELPRLPSCQPKHKVDLWGLAAIALRKGCAHLDVSSYQIRWLLVRLQGDVDGGKRPAGHLLHLPQQLLRKKRKKKRSAKVSDRWKQTVYSQFSNELLTMTPACFISSYWSKFNTFNTEHF